jgi:hypothetical protein
MKILECKSTITKIKGSVAKQRRQKKKTGNGKVEQKQIHIKNRGQLD